MRNKQKNARHMPGSYLKITVQHPGAYFAKTFFSLKFFFSMSGFKKGGVYSNYMLHDGMIYTIIFVIGYPVDVG